jgi:hypothetical protein
LFLGGALVTSQDGDDSIVLTASQQQWITVTSPNGHVHLRMLSLYAPVAVTLAREWERVGVLTSTSDLAFSNLTQDLKADYQNAPSHTFFRLDLNPSSGQIASDSIVVGFNDVSECATHPEYRSGDWSLEGTAIVETWFSGEHSFPAGVSIPDPRALQQLRALQELPTRQAQAWVKANEKKIRSCSWNRSDFP